MEKGKKILSKFIAEEKVSEDELKCLQQWLSDDSKIEEVLKEEWNKGDEKETQIQFDSIQYKIRNIKEGSERTTRIQKIFTNYQKIAAIVLIPVLTLVIYFMVQQSNAEIIFFQTTAERGQKSQVVLPDGTKVWLNSDSQMKYADNFGKKDRTVKLVGEAYFEVAKNVHKPFLVEAGKTKLKVLGTTFNLKAYPDENEIETTLIEGKVELTVPPYNENKTLRTLELQPGESLIFNKITNRLEYGTFKIEEILAWTNNQLIFRNENFEHLVKKIERWYDVDIIYDQASLNEQRLTVELYEGELLYRLLDIIELAIDVECISEKDKIYIKTKDE